RPCKRWRVVTRSHKKEKARCEYPRTGLFVHPARLRQRTRTGGSGALRATNPAITDTANRTIVTKFTILAASMGTSAIRSQATPRAAPGEPVQGLESTAEIIIGVMSGRRARASA